MHIWYIYIYIYMNMYVLVYVHICVHIRIHMYTHIYIYVYMHMCIYAYICVWTDTETPGRPHGRACVDRGVGSETIAVSTELRVSSTTWHHRAFMWMKKNSQLSLHTNTRYKYCRWGLSGLVRRCGVGGRRLRFGYGSWSPRTSRKTKTN